MLSFIGLETIPSFGKYSFNDIAGDYLIYAVSIIVLFYMFYFFVSKKHLNKKKIIYLIIFGLLFLIVVNVPIVFIYLYFLAKEVFDLSGDKFVIEYLKCYLSFLETNFSFVVFGSLLKIALLWYENTMKQKEIEKQLISGELAMLRSQINPQFLFNTLTNIRSLIEKSPDKAVYSIENLSEIMSYMLYESSADKVFLDDEINYINNYLNLQRVRYNPGFIDFNITGDTAGIFVPPLLFMPFIENAFKYGDGFSKTPGIVINLNVRGNNLSFEVTNNINKDAGPVNSEDGFSIKSIKRRLDLIFGNNYSLEIKNENSKYLIKLKIKPAKVPFQNLPDQNDSITKKL